jgi:hypothetical protein
MDEVIGRFTHVHCVKMNCPDGDNQFCYIPLPLQSPLGIYVGQQYQPMGGWPATFLCLRHGRASAYWPDSIRHEIEPMVLGQPVPQMWKIECECAHENCGTLHTIYTARAPDWETILKAVAKWNPNVPCGDHLLIWTKELMRGTEFAYNSPVP